jgi:hypothetical protein
MSRGIGEEEEDGGRRTEDGGQKTEVGRREYSVIMSTRLPARKTLSGGNEMVGQVVEGWFMYPKPGMTAVCDRL